MAGRAMVRGGGGDALLPGVVDGAEVKALVDRLSRGLGVDDHGKEALAALPSAMERQMLRRRAEELEKQIAPIGPGDTANPGGPGWSRARASLLLLFGGYDSMNFVNMEDTVDLYLGWLADLPAYAISEACQRIGRGVARWRNPENGREEVIGLKRPPTHAVLHMVARDIAGERRDELTRVEKLLRIERQIPKAPSAAERERVGKQMAELAAMLRRPMEAVRDPEEDRRQAERLAESKRRLEGAWLAEGYEPFYVNGYLSSPEMFKQVRDWPPAGAVPLKKPQGAGNGMDVGE